MMNRMLDRRYAKALLEAAADADCVGVVAEQFAGFIDLLKSSADMQKVIDSPTVSPVSRRRVMEKIVEKAGYKDIFANFIIVLNEKGRIKNISGILESFLELIDESKGIVTAKLSYAGVLSDEEMKNIKSTLEKISGNEVNLDIEMDPQLIGGIRVEMAGTIYDGSLKNRINMLKDQLTGE
jgi:F-type H+-transporting ATPase subunit delta